jgi:hypothetical protein
VMVQTLYRNQRKLIECENFFVRLGGDILMTEFSLLNRTNLRNILKLALTKLL